MKRIDKIDDVKFVNCDSYERDVLLSDKIDELIPAHNFQLEGYEMRNLTKEEQKIFEGFKKKNFSECELVETRTLDGLVSALEYVLNEEQPERIKDVARKALQNYKRGGV